jgi:hypothetical protein
MANIKYIVQSWNESEIEETVAMSDGHGETADIIIPSIEVEDFIEDEFETLADALIKYDETANKIRCIQYKCDERFQGMKTYKNSQFSNNSEVIANAASDIEQCETEVEPPTI